MKVDDLITELLRAKNEGVKEITIDKNNSKVNSKYGYLICLDSDNRLRGKIRIIRSE